MPRRRVAFSLSFRSKRHWYFLMLLGCMYLLWILRQESKMLIEGYLDTDPSVTENKKNSIMWNDPIYGYQVRRETMLKACKKRDVHFNTSTVKIRRSILLDRRRGLLYCPIEKIASTFWKKILRKAAFSNTKGKLEVLEDVNELERGALLEKATKFIFVRDPYRRLFSAYVDKLFSPNTLFWKVMGTFIIKTFRKNASEAEQKCGHNVSFKELVKFFINMMSNKNLNDGHFSPQYLHCDPCFYKYDIIGKFETLEEDTLHILKTFGLSTLFKSTYQEFHRQHLLTTIQFEFKKLLFYYNYNYGEYHACLSFSEAEHLVWKKMKITGLISRKFTIPAKHFVHNMSKEELTILIHNNIGDVLDPDIANKNREDAFVEAYRTIDREDLEKLKEIFLPDCELFGYDCHPSAIFKKENV